MTSAQPLRVGVLGAGRLGSLVADAVRAADDLELAFVQGREAPHGAGEGTSSAADVAVDVSHADAVPAHLDWAARTGTDLVIGTTGWDPALLERADLAGIGVLVAPSFSLSVALLHRLTTVLGRYAVLVAGQGGGADLAVGEVHHRAKVDAPSGTALALAQTLATAAGRAREQVQTTSLRLGAVVGRHEVRLHTDAEAVTLTHETFDRAAFAAGALAAARWVHGRPGRHGFEAVAAQLLDPLFDP